MNFNQQSAVDWPVNQIACPLIARESTGVIRELVARMAGVPGVLDVVALGQALERREAVSPTYLGGGVAMPHARTEAVDRLVVAVGLSGQGLGWGSHRELARLVFLVGVPRDADGAYLEMVRRITHTVRHLDWLEQAMACPDAPTLARLLNSTIHL